MVYPTFYSIKIANFNGIDTERAFVFNPRPDRYLTSNLFEINGTCASGKTSFVNAFRFISTCMRSNMPMRVYPVGATFGRNKNHPETDNSVFEVCMYENSTKYRYTLSVNFADNEIKSEKLEYMPDNTEEWIVVYNRVRNNTDATTVCLRMYTLQQQIFDGDEDIKIRMLSDIVGPDKTFLHVAFDYIERAPTSCKLYDNWKHIYAVGNCLKHKLVAPANLLTVQLNRGLVCSEKFLHIIQGFDFKEIAGINTDGNPDTTTINHYGKWIENFRNEPESVQKLIELMNVMLSKPECMIVIDDLDACFHPVLTRGILILLQKYYSGSVIYTTRRDVGEDFGGMPKRNTIQSGSF